MKKSILFLFLAIFFSTHPSPGTAQEAEKRPVITEPGIVLTFDDAHNLESWAKRIPLFKKYGAKATFFLDKPDRINDKQKEYMKQLAGIGCEMACHGFRHLNASDVAAQKGIAAYLSEEIEPAVKKLEALGYPQYSFAYPGSRRSEETDKALEKYFRHIRTGGAVCDRRFDKSNHLFTPIEKVRDRFLILGVRFDQTTVEGVGKNVQASLERIKQKREILLLYGHGIVDQGAGTYQTNEDALEELLKRTEGLGLRFYTMAEL